jgi:hypothetical protein
VLDLGLPKRDDLSVLKSCADVIGCRWILTARDSGADKSPGWTRGRRR